MALESYRRAIILGALEASGRIRIKDLSARLDVSSMTIRRDLEDLEADGLLVRVHGGAVSISAGETQSVHAREVIHSKEKGQIARAISAEVPDGSRIIMDNGTTVAAVAPLLRGRSIEVITGSILVASVLASDSGIRLHLLGGDIRSQTMSVVGPAIETQLEPFKADIALLGASSVNASGFRNLYPADVPAQRAIIRASATVWLLVDQSKWGTERGSRVAGLEEITGVVTNAAPSETVLPRSTRVLLG